MQVAYSELPQDDDGVELGAGELGAAAGVAPGAGAGASVEPSVLAAGALASAGLGSDPESGAGSLPFAA